MSMTSMLRRQIHTVSRLGRLGYSTVAPRAFLDEKGVTISWPDNRQTRFHHEYLLDHCRCPRCFHPVTKQRLKTLVDFDPTVRPQDLVSYDDRVVIKWPNDHSSEFPFTVLERAAYDPPLMQLRREEPLLWTSEIAGSPPTMEHDEVMAEGPDGRRAVLKWLDLIAKCGFCFLQGVPANPEATEQAIRRIAPIRETHYGGFWDFTANMAHGDLAYSNQALPAHTDTTYFTDPAGLQIFHLLSHEGTGGSSLLVDGFYAASQLSPSAYVTLSRLGLPSHASGSPGTILRPMSRPSLIHDDHGQLVQIRWNNEDRGVIGAGWTAEDVASWYAAARELEKVNRSPAAEYWKQLEPGTMVAIDNWRVMHGRSAFTGSRRMCGAYIGADDWRSRRAALRTDLEGVNDPIWDFGW